MLTADLVRGTRRGGQLHVAPPKGKKRARAVELADASVGLLQALVGAPRDEVMAALGAVEAEGRERLLLRGLQKLLLDRCVFEVAEGPDPRTLREDLFTRAAAERLALDDDTPLDTETLTAQVAADHGLDAGDLQRLLYADLRGTHLLRQAPTLSAEALVDGYGAALEQAVLLRAERVEVTLHTEDAEVLRRLLRACKFRRLLWTLERADAGWTLTLDGPTSLLRSSTRYGLQLAMLLPVIRTCDRFELTAHVRWGKARTPLTWQLSGGARRGRSKRPALPLPDDIARLLDDIDRLDTPWTASATADVVELPGVGWCVPDVALSHPELGTVSLEVLGYWSRDAAWRRIELARAGLDRPMVFALSSRLRVDESVLPDDLPAALYVYKGVMHARRVLERAEAAATAHRR